MSTTTMPEKTHQGRAIKRLREILHVKQEVIASALNISQQSVSLLENRETVEPEQLELIAQTLRVPVDVIKNYTEEAAVSYINNFHDNSVSHLIGHNGTYNFNPIEKWMEAMEEIKRLNEALLQEKEAQIALLKSFLAGKK